MHSQTTSPVWASTNAYQIQHGVSIVCFPTLTDKHAKLVGRYNVRHYFNATT